jgi:predicted enzyme related to lactoylglutathione lyase
MAVLRIVANRKAEDPATLAAFYRRLFGLDPVMDMGWITTLAAEVAAPVQISFASEGGSGTDVPDLSIEVDDLDAVLARAHDMGTDPVYGPVTEPWGVRRFYLRDPQGTLLNILSHHPA